MSKGFVSLHTHTSYSQLDGASKIPEFVKRVKELGMTAAGVSDHGNVSGIIDFYKECKKQEIKPVLGQEFYFTDDRLLRESVKQSDENGEIDGSDKRYYHLSVYAENNTGYQNLLKLSSDAFITGFYHKPRSDYSSLERYSKGLIVGSGCLGGPVLQPLIHGNFDAALETAGRLRDIVGQDNFFIELMNHNLPEQLKTNPLLLDIAKRLGVRAYASQDTHYTHKEDAHSHSVLLCQPAGTKITSIKSFSRKGLPRGGFIPNEIYTKNIEDIKVGDQVVTWSGDQRRGRMVASGSRVSEIGRRQYYGDIVNITTPSGASSSYTMDHITIARLDAPLVSGNYVVYLMRRGDLFRIGFTQYRKEASNLLGVVSRTKENNAEEVWILKIFQTKHEAMEEEAFLSWRYGIPTWSFTGQKKKEHEPRTPYYESLWNRIDGLYERALRCLNDHGKMIQYPFYSIKQTPKHFRMPFEVRACNLESGMLACEPGQMSDPTGPTYGGSGAWQPIAVSRHHFEGEVFSIEVEKYHTYIADGIVTHNCCQTGAKLSDPNRFHFHNDEYYLKSPEDMRRIFRENPEVCDNTLLIAERADVKIDFTSLHLPQFPVPEGFIDDVDYLTYLVEEGIEKFYPNATDEVYDRALYELGVFKSMGVSSYMLILWDLMKYARSEGIFTPPGRGSAAGSLVSYVLEITKVDPLRYGLIFERFLNPSRIALPDVDLDIEQRYREKIIDYTIKKYGSDHVAQIITFGTIKARTAVRDSASVLGFEASFGDKISKLMPPLISGVDTPLSACFDLDPRYEAGYKAAQGLRELYEADPKVQEVIDTARGIEGLIKSSGIHAAGIVIGDRPLDEIVPLFVNKKGVTATQWGKKTIEALGLVKMDYLGLKNLDILSDAQQLVREHTPDFDIDSLPMDDPETYAMLRTGNTIGCFQIESAGMRQLLKKLGPDKIEDISAVLALFRPGPMAQNWHNDYADRKNGRQAPVPFHPAAEPLLNSTYGLMIYQEQIMKIASEFAGYSLTEADNLRKIIGKKEVEAMKQERLKFVAGCETQGHSTQFSNDLFDTIDGFSLYGFNLSHSMSYAFITYWTAYLKTHYPREYMSVVCSYARDLDENALYLGEVRRMGLKIYPPDLNKSELSYTVEEDGIRIGLGTLKNLGEGSTEQLIQIRQEKEFDGLYDFALRVNPNVNAFKSLAYSGALDQFGTRQGIASVAPDILAKARKEKKKVNQESLFEIDTVVDFNIPNTEFQWHELLNKEKETMGIYASGHPLTEYQEYSTGSTITSIKDSAEGTSKKILAIITGFDIKYTRKQEAMAIAQIEDLTGAIEVVIFPKTLEKHCQGMRVGSIWSLSIRKGTDFRDETNYIVSFADEIESKIVEVSTSKKFGIYLPKGFQNKPQMMSQLKGILLQHHGSIPVDIYISRSTTLNLENQYLVESTNELKEEIKNLFIEYRGGV